MMRMILLVALGGGLGSIARFVAQRWLNPANQDVFPTGTFLVNLVGCLLIGLLWGLSERTQPWNDSWKLFLFTGICGGFTTFSAYSQESLALLRDGKNMLFFLYAGGTLLGGLLLTWIGYKFIA